MADDENNKHDHWPFWAGIGLFVLIVGVYSFSIDGSLSTDTSDWGTFGDYVGGLANPVIALIVLYYVYRAFLSQRKQIKEAREEFVKSRKEQEKQTIIQKNESKIIIRQHKMDRLQLIRDWYNKKSEEVHSNIEQQKKYPADFDGKLGYLEGRRDHFEERIAETEIRILDIFNEIEELETQIDNL